MPSSHSSSNDTDAYVNDSTHFYNNDKGRKCIWRVGIMGENVTDLLASVNYITYM